MQPMNDHFDSLISENNFQPPYVKKHGRSTLVVFHMVVLLVIVGPSNLVTYFRPFVSELNETDLHCKRGMILRTVKQMLRGYRPVLLLRLLDLLHLLSLLLPVLSLALIGVVVPQALYGLHYVA